MNRLKMLLILILAGTASVSQAWRDLETGTFLTRDPIGFEDGPNQYCYVSCNPITKFDAIGLAHVTDALSDIPVVGWLGGLISATGAGILGSADGVATGGGQWNSERNADRDIPAVFLKDDLGRGKKSGDTMSHMDVSPMMDLPLSGSASSPTVQEHVDELNKEGQKKEPDVSVETAGLK